MPRYPFHHSYFQSRPIATANRLSTPAQLFTAIAPAAPVDGVELAALDTALPAALDRDPVVVALVPVERAVDVPDPLPLVLPVTVISLTIVNG